MQGRCSGLFCWTSKYTYSVVTGRLYYAICAFMTVVCHTSSKTICREKYLYITRLCICKLLALGMWLKTLYWKYCIMTTHISYKVYPEADEFKAVDKKYHFVFIETHRKISWMTLIRISFLPIPYFIWSSLKGKKSKYVKFERGI